MKDLAMARRLAEAVAARGGRVYYVGGFVRDRLLGRENKDVDVEVHGIGPEVLEEILDGLGKRLEMGRNFGVYGLRGYDLDIAMPRGENAPCRGELDFQDYVDPFVGTEKAALRRDFTINALMEDVLTGEVIDHFHGQEDLKAGIIRHVNDDTFREDHLRVLRAAQFGARFGFRLAPETAQLCASLDLQGLPRERVLEEVRKALLKAERPSVFFEILRQLNQLSVWFPELEALQGVEQSRRHHKEGDVWVHTMLVLDAAARHREQVKQPFWFLLSALVHDFGKAVATEFVKGDSHAYGHDVKGLPLVEKFLYRMTIEKDLVRYVLNMTQLHMAPNLMEQRTSVKSSNKLYDRSVCPEDLILLSVCDNLGRIAEEERPSKEPLLRSRLEVYREYMSRPFVMGADLVAAGLKPGPQFKDILEFSHKLRLAGVPKESALKQSLAQAGIRRKAEQDDCS